MLAREAYHKSAWELVCVLIICGRVCVCTCMYVGLGSLPQKCMGVSLCVNCMWACMCCVWIWDVGSM